MCVMQKRLLTESRSSVPISTRPVALEVQSAKIAGRPEIKLERRESPWHPGLLLELAWTNLHA